MTENKTTIQTRHRTPYTPQPPHTSHPHTTKQMPAITKIHQRKRRQSCRENNAIKAADSVVFLRMTCRRQIQRRNTRHRTPYTPQPPHTSHPHTTEMRGDARRCDGQRLGAATAECGTVRQTAATSSWPPIQIPFGAQYGRVRPGAPTGRAQLLHSIVRQHLHRHHGHSCCHPVAHSTAEYGQVRQQAEHSCYTA